MVRRVCTHTVKVRGHGAHADMEAEPEMRAEAALALAEHHAEVGEYPAALEVLAAAETAAAAAGGIDASSPDAFAQLHRRARLLLRLGQQASAPFFGSLQGAGVCGMLQGAMWGGRLAACMMRMAACCLNRLCGVRQEAYLDLMLPVLNRSLRTFESAPVSGRRMKAALKRRKRATARNAGAHETEAVFKVCQSAFVVPPTPESHAMLL